MEGSNEAGMIPPVMSLLNSSNVYPIANFAAPLAIGKPVALEAKADDLDTLGFISITYTSPSSGLIVNCTFEPPVSTPISLKISIEAFLII